LNGLPTTQCTRSARSVWPGRLERKADTSAKVSAFRSRMEDAAAERRAEVVAQRRADAAERKAEVMRLPTICAANIAIGEQAQEFDENDPTASEPGLGCPLLPEILTDEDVMESLRAGLTTQSWANYYQTQFPELRYERQPSPTGEQAMETQPSPEHAAVETDSPPRT
jgi:hypothetical protein